MNAKDRLLRWLGIGAMLAGITLAAQAQYQLRTEVNPDGMVTVYKGADCPSGALIIPDAIDGQKVTGIGPLGFIGCTGLTSVQIADGVTYIGDHAFFGCTGLTNVTMPDTVTSIGGGAFSFGSFTDVKLGRHLTSIREWAFQGCTRLTRVWSLIASST